LVGEGYVMSKLESNPQFERFTKVIDGLMAVSYKELQQALREEKAQKAKRKRAKPMSLPALRRVLLN
jgi:hypothetical protein